MNNKEFGKNIMKVNVWGDFEKYEKINDSEESSQIKEPQIKVCSFILLHAYKMIFIYLKGYVWMDQRSIRKRPIFTFSR